VGGLDIGLERASMEIKYQVENDPYCIKVLEKHWPNVKRYEDVREIRGSELPTVDIIAGGVPCQDVSCAGKGEGIHGSRSGLFFEMARIIEEARPRYVIIENVPALVRRGLDIIGEELRLRGYRTLRPLLIEAASVGAPHKRERIFIVAIRREDVDDTQSIGRNNGQSTDKGENKGKINTPGYTGKMPAMAVRLPESDLNSDTNGDGRKRWAISDQSRKEGNDINGICEEVAVPEGARQREHGGKVHAVTEPYGFSIEGLSEWWSVEPCFCRVVGRCPSRVDRLRGLGNIVVPHVAEMVGRLVIDLDKIINGE